ncbi:MAG: response regulator [bacterium]
MKTRVLLVDDEEGYVQPLSERLTARGFDVSVAYTGESALELVERQNFDVVLLDVMMPGKGGIETFKQIRNIDLLVHVIMLTGYAEVETAIEEIRSGAFDYLVKPVQIDHLEERIRFAHHHKTLQEKRLRDKIDGTDRGPR